VCGDNPNPDINKDDVSKDKGHALSDGVTPSDGQQALEGHLAGKKPRLLEEFGTRTFEDVWPEVKGIKENVAPTSVDDAWRSIGNQLHTSAVNFETEVKKLKAGGGWEGKTIEAAYTNAINSISEPFYTGTAALRGAELTHKFRDVMNYVHKNLVNDPLGQYSTMWERYEFDRDYQKVTRGGKGWSQTTNEPTTAGEKEAIRQYYNEYMRIVMNDSYKPGINDIYNNYPQYAENTQPAQPITIPGLPEKPGQPSHKGTGDPSLGNGGGTPPGGGGGFKKPDLGTAKPSITKPPSLEDLKNQTKFPTDTDTPGQTDNPTQNDPSRPSVTDPSKALDNGLTSGLTNAATQAMGGATQAASQAAQAAKASPNGLSNGLGNKPKLPEGALQLGKGGTGPGAGGARGGGGASLGGAAPRLSSLPAAAIQSEAAGISKAGMGAASPGMGAPGTPGGAGHGGGGQQQGKEHKVTKALRSRKTGTEIAGEAEAVVPVIGQDQGPDQDQDQQDEVAAQRGPDRPRGPSAATPPMPASPAGPERRQVGGRG
jgi:hypothetical protein